MGTTTIIIAIVRLVISIATLDTFDITSLLIPVWLMTEIEAFFAAAVVNLPGLRVLFRRVERAGGNVPYDNLGNSQTSLDPK